MSVVTHFLADFNQTERAKRISKPIYYSANRPVLAYHDWQTLVVLIKCMQSTNMENPSTNNLNGFGLADPGWHIGPMDGWCSAVFLLPNLVLLHRAHLSLVFHCVHICFTALCVFILEMFQQSSADATHFVWSTFASSPLHTLFPSCCLPWWLA